MSWKFVHKKFILFTNFHYHLIPYLPIVMHCNEIYEENWDDWNWTNMTINVVRKFSTEITIVFIPITTYQTGRNSNSYICGRD